MDRREVLTVGHSVIPIERFLAALRAQGVEALADVRRFPGSRRHPQFGADRLHAALAAEGVGYRWFEDLGGRRDTHRLSTENAGWRVAAFHAYADWMRGPGFAAALESLESFARERPTVVMCAEALWTRCHRRLIADALEVRGWNVRHLLPPSRIEPHRLPDFARRVDGGLVYPPGGLTPAHGHA